MRMADVALDTRKLEGVWWDFQTKEPCPGNKPHETHGCFLIVPHIGSRYDTALAEEQQPYLELIRRKPNDGERDAHATLVEDMLAKTSARAMARTLLRGWANWEKPDDTPLVWSEEEATRILGDRGYLAVRKFVESAASFNDAALAREEEQARGN